MALLESLPLPLGADIIAFFLPAADGKTYSLSDFERAKALVVVFTCNHCPYAQASWPKLVSLAKEFAPRDVQFLAINPNDEAAYPEDSFDAMKLFVKEHGISFPYLRDDSQETARSYQAQCTPDIYVFDQNRRLAYHGRIDDNWKEPEKVTRQDLRDALAALVEGRAVSQEQSPSMGCSIKWR